MSKARPRGKPIDDMRVEYQLDYTRARPSLAEPSRFASQLSRKVVAVVLEPDVARVLDTSESVNSLLRSVISAVPNDGTGRQLASHAAKWAEEREGKW